MKPFLQDRDTLCKRKRNWGKKLGKSERPSTLSRKQSIVSRLVRDCNPGARLLGAKPALDSHVLGGPCAPPQRTGGSSGAEEYFPWALAMPPHLQKKSHCPAPAPLSRSGWWRAERGGAGLGSPQPRWLLATLRLCVRAHTITHTHTQSLHRVLPSWSPTFPSRQGLREEFYQGTKLLLGPSPSPLDHNVYKW